MIDNNIKWKIIERLETNRDDKVLCMIIGEDKSITTYASCTVGEAKEMLREMITQDFYARRLVMELCIEIIENGLMREATQ